jgi:hypothetical protein
VEFNRQLFKVHRDKALGAWGYGANCRPPSLSAALRLAIEDKWASDDRPIAPRSSRPTMWKSSCRYRCNRAVETLRHGVLLVVGAPGQLQSLAGQEHCRTILLAEMGYSLSSVAYNAKTLDGGPQNWQARWLVAAPANTAAELGWEL